MSGKGGKGTVGAKSKFTAEERTKMLTAAWIAGTAVSETDQVGGNRAQAKEAEVLRNAIARCVTVYQVKTGENLSGEPAAFEHDKAEAKIYPACQEVLAMLEKKDSAENIDAYKFLVLDVAHSVAAAYGAGFLGTGQKVSAAEDQLIGKIAEALKATHLVESVRKSAEVGKLK